MRVLLYAAHEFPPMAFFAEGIRACGDRVIWRNPTGYGPGNYEACDVAVIFGLQGGTDAILRDQRARGTPVVVVDMGYVKRGNTIAARQQPHAVYWSVGLNGLNGHADSLTGPMPGDRWRALGVSLQSWRTEGTHVLVCGQRPFDAAIPRIDPSVWARETVTLLQSLTQRPIVFRPHPEDAGHRRIPHVTYSVHPHLVDDLRNCHAVVAYNSNSLVEAVIAGIPAFALGEGSMVEAVSEHILDQIEQPSFPDRQQWAHDLAYRQYTWPEFASGLAWRNLLYRGAESVSEIAQEHESIRLHVEVERTEDLPHHAPRRGRPPKARALSGDARE